jgi:pantetheine-phosphate adenylyltransferase
MEEREKTPSPTLASACKPPTTPGCAAAGGGLKIFLVKRWKKCQSAGVRTVIYPGSFDPLTNGHLDVVQRAAKLFDRVVVAVAKNSDKKPLFSLPERLELVKKSITHLPNVEVDALDGLLVDYVVRQKARAIVRGLRAVSDFEFEFQLALMNRKLNENVETIFMMPKDTYTFLSSRIVKEIARLGGDVAVFVPAHVQTALTQKFNLAASVKPSLEP